MRKLKNAKLCHLPSKGTHSSTYFSKLAHPRLWGENSGSRVLCFWSGTLINILYCYIFFSYPSLSCTAMQYIRHLKDGVWVSCSERFFIFFFCWASAAPWDGAAPTSKKRKRPKAFLQHALCQDNFDGMPQLLFILLCLLDLASQFWWNASARFHFLEVGRATLVGCLTSF